MNGTILPETIKELSHEKEVSLFVDGDRGGKLIARNAIDNAKVDYVAVAPDGKEVEELTPKEILTSLRKKLKAEEISKKSGNETSRTRRDYKERPTRRKESAAGKENSSKGNKREMKFFSDRQIVDNLTKRILSRDF